MLLFSSVLLKKDVLDHDIRTGSIASEVEEETHFLHVYTCNILKLIDKLFISRDSMSVSAVEGVVISCLHKLDGYARMVVVKQDFAREVVMFGSRS